MPVPNWFRTLDLDGAEDLIEKRRPEALETNRAFFEGDHWQDGDGWIGPMPSQNEEGYQEAHGQIKAAFTSRNVIREVIERHETGVVGRSPSWNIVPKEGDTKEAGEEEGPSDEMEDKIQEATDLLRAWWDDKEVHEVIQKAVDTALYAERAPLRVFVPRGLLENGQVPSGDVAEQLDRIYVDHVDPEVATVYEDPDSRAEISLVVYEVEEGDPTSAASETVERAEVSFVRDGDGRTVIRAFGRRVRGTSEGPAEGEPQEFEAAMGGRLPVFEIERSALINEQVRQAQKALNLANSMIPRNVVTGGFLERVLLNAQMPGEWEVVNEETGEKRWKPDPVEFGAGRVQWLQGIETETQEGDERITTPQIEYRDPVPIDASEDAKRSHYQDILEETDQAHILMSGEATPSGRSRREARADFARSLRRTQSPVESAVSWVLETVLAMAEHFAGTAGRFTEELRVSAEAQIDLGETPPDEQQVVAGHADRGLLSRQTAMARIGVDDPEAELRRLESQDDSQLDLRERQAEVIRAYKTAGLDLMTAARLAGFSEEEAVEFFADANERDMRLIEQEAGFSAAVRERIRNRIGVGNGGGEEGGESEPGGT